MPAITRSQSKTISKKQNNDINKNSINHSQQPNNTNARAFISILNNKFREIKTHQRTNISKTDNEYIDNKCYTYRLITELYYIIQEWFYVIIYVDNYIYPKWKQFLLVTHNKAIKFLKELSHVDHTKYTKEHLYIENTFVNELLSTIKLIDNYKEQL